MSYTGHLDNYDEILECELDEMSFELHLAQLEIVKRDRLISDLEERVALLEGVVQGLCKAVGVKSL